MALGGGVPQGVARDGRPGPVREDFEPSAGVRGARVQRVGDVGEEEGDVLLGAERDARTGSGGAGELGRAVLRDPYALEEGDGRWEVAGVRPFLRAASLNSSRPAA